MVNDVSLSRAPLHFSRFVAPFILAFMFAGSASAALVRTVENGKLTGATGVNVGGTLYDVWFEDGSCAALFAACDSTADFDIQNTSIAQLASTALLEQVFLDDFDTTPSLTFGCPGSVGNDFCKVITPYSFLAATTSFQYWSAVNHAAIVESLTVGDYLVNGHDGTSIPISLDMASASGPGPNIVFARWSHASQVPEPSSLALLGLAGVALGWSQRRRRVRANDGVQ